MPDVAGDTSGCHRGRQCGISHRDGVSAAARYRGDLGVVAGSDVNSGARLCAVLVVWP